MMYSRSLVLTGFLLSSSQAFLSPISQSHSNLSNSSFSQRGALSSVQQRTSSVSLLTMSAQSTEVSSSWDDLKISSAGQAVGSAMNNEVELRKVGRGSSHVQNTLRLYDTPEGEAPPKITLYRDHAGWCPYCQKTSKHSIYNILLNM